MNAYMLTISKARRGVWGSCLADLWSQLQTQGSSLWNENREECDPIYIVSVSQVRQRRSQPVPSAQEWPMDCPHASPLVIQEQQMSEPPEPAESSSINQRTFKYWHGVSLQSGIIMLNLCLTRMAYAPIRCADSGTCAQGTLNIKRCKEARGITQSTWRKP